MPAWDELFLRQRTNGSLMTGVDVQVSGANLYKRRVITSCSHDNEAAHMIVWLLVSRGDHVHIARLGWMENVMRPCAELCQRCAAWSVAA